MDSETNECPICGEIGLLDYYKGGKICSKCRNEIEKTDKHKKELVKSLIREKKYRKSTDVIGSKEWGKNLGIYGVHTKREKETFIRVVKDINNRNISNTNLK